MITFKIRFVLEFFAALFVAFTVMLSSVEAKEISCSSLERCEEEVTTAIYAGKDYSSRVSYYNVSRAFLKFEQDGFDTLFKAMENASGDTQDIFLSALAFMKSGSRNPTNLQISRAQYKTLKQMWMQVDENYYSIAGLINQADASVAHSFMIKALQSPEEERRYWAEQVISLDRFGDGKYAIDAKHLRDILSLIADKKLSALVPALLRIDSPKAVDALWLLLEADDRWVFDKAFSLLLKEDEERVYKLLKAQSFADTTAGRQRALMIAETIRQQRHKIKPSAQAYHFWKDWYEAAGTSEAEKIIPSYLLFYLFEAKKETVEGADKYIEDRERWRGFTQANPKGRTGHLSVENINLEIREKRAETSRLMPLFRLQDARLKQDETQTLRDYFRIFDAQKESVTEKNYTYGGGDYLPLTSVLDTAIQSPEIWAARFWTYVKDETFVENTALVEKITALETNEDRLKEFYLRRLEQVDNIPKLIGTLVLISGNDILREDRDIKSAIQAVTKNTPFTRLRMAGEPTLHKRLPDEDINPFVFFRWGSSSEDAMIAANARRRYCGPPSRGEDSYMSIPPKLNPPRTGLYNQLGYGKMTVKTTSGYLTGHDSGEFGGGLVYYSDIASEGQVLSLTYAINIIAISESETEGVYWVLAGLNHGIPGMGVVYKVDARTDRVTVIPHKRLPSVPRETSFLKNGDLFMDFRARSYTTFDMENGGVETKHKIADEKYNPPVILTKSGEVINACRD